MRWLPVVGWPTPVAVPLADSTAEGLISALLTSDLAARAGQLASTLANDPPLAVWAVCRAAALGHRDFDTLGKLAEWMAWLPAADYFSAESPQNHRPPTKRSAQSDWVDRVATALAEAVLAARCAQQAGLDQDEAYALALVHRARRWLMPEPDGGTVSPWLPEWLAEVPAASPAVAGRLPSTVRDCVALACLEVSGGATSPHDRLPFHFDLAAHNALVANARSNWLRSSGGGQRLQFLVSQLSRVEELETRFDRSLEAAKLDSLKELAYGASHEINNPLANISARAQTLLTAEHDPERRRTLATIHTQALRAHEMIADLMLFARPPKPKRERTEIATLVATVVEELSQAAASQDTELLFHAPAKALFASVDKTQLAVAVRALCANALQALGRGGRVECTLQHCPADAAENFRSGHETMQLTVTDNGPGLSPSAKQHLFDPFYSGREAGRGLGLGLSKCWRIVSMHGGQVDVESRPGEGSRFSIRLPIEPDC
jgi:signal transduction histidine kinase